jgi:hypothetical protein
LILEDTGRPFWVDVFWKSKAGNAKTAWGAFLWGFILVVILFNMRAWDNFTWGGLLEIWIGLLIHFLMNVPIHFLMNVHIQDSVVVRSVIISVGGLLLARGAIGLFDDLRFLWQRRRWPHPPEVFIFIFLGGLAVAAYYYGVSASSFETFFILWGVAWFAFFKFMERRERRKQNPPTSE